MMHSAFHPLNEARWWFDEIHRISDGGWRGNVLVPTRRCWPA